MVCWPWHNSSGAETQILHQRDVLSLLPTWSPACSHTQPSEQPPSASLRQLQSVAPSYHCSQKVPYQWRHQHCPALTVWLSDHQPQQLPERQKGDKQDPGERQMD